MQTRPVKFPVMILFSIVLFAAHAAGDSFDLPEIQTRDASLSQNTVNVPDLFSMKKQEARAALKQAGLTPLFKKQTRMNFDLVGMECRVLSQLPLPGEQVAPGSEVVISIYVPVGSCDNLKDPKP